MVDKAQVVELLEETAELLALLGENSFKIRAYQHAAQVINNLDEDIAALVKSKRLQELPGIGEALSQKITEFVETGKLDYFEKLKAQLPGGLLELLKIQGLGPRKVKAIYDHLKVTNIDELQRACKNNKIAQLEGFGLRTQQNILRGIAFLQKSSEQFLYPEASAEAQRIAAALKSLTEVKELAIAGSLRRHRELVRDIDILVAASSGAAVRKTFANLSGIDKILADGETKSSIALNNGLNVDLRIVTPEQFPYALLHFTGSKEHNVALRGLAIKLGLKMNEYGLFKGERLIKCRSEAEIYQRLGLDYIPPELRESCGEIEAAQNNQLPKLVEREEILGLFHLHTTYSDGHNSLQEMAEECRRLGFKYMVVADHSQKAVYANGLTLARILKQHEEIDQLNRTYKDFKIFKGIECEILRNGDLDYSSEILKRFEIVIGAVHQPYKQTEAELTARIIKAMQNKYFSILAHPTGRLLLERNGYPVNLEQVIKAAAEYGKAIEINCNPYRLDLDWRFCKLAKELGVKIALSPDAHRLENIKDIFIGLGIARKGWLEKKDVLNCLPPEKLLKQKK